MKKFRYFFLMSMTCAFFSCEDPGEDPYLGDWQRRTVFPRNPLCHAATFVIGDNGYVVGGFNGTRPARSEVYAFNRVSGMWNQHLKSLPAIARQQAVGFSILNPDNDAAGYGYVGTGWVRQNEDDERTEKDFWKYDPVNDTWKEVAPLPEEAMPRRGAFAFSLKVGNKYYGYVGGGFTDRPDNEYLSDLWVFDPDGTTPNTDPEVNGGEDWEGRWTPVETPFGKRIGGVAFVIDNKAYICSGRNNSGAINDFNLCEPQNTNDPADLKWSKLRIMNAVHPDESYDDDYATLGRAHGVAFVLPAEGGKMRGHIVGGDQNAGSSCWEYNDDDDLWFQRTSFYNNTTRQSREGMVAFSFQARGNNKAQAFVGMGRSGTQIFDDLWEFIPLEDDEIYTDWQ